MAKKPLVKSSKKISVTVQAAIVTTIGAILTTFITGFFGLIKVNNPFSSETEVTSTATSTIVVTSPTSKILVSPNDLIKDAYSWKTFFIDDFNDNSGNWKSINEPLNPNVIISFDGEFNILVDTLDGEQLRETFFRFVEDTPQNFLIKVDTRSMEDNACRYGIVFRGNINNDFYRFSIKDNNRFLFEEIKEGDRQYLIDSPIPENIKEPVSLSAIVFESIIKLFVNDIYVAEFNDDHVQGNRVGVDVFLCGDRKVKFGFDQFEVKEIPNGFDLSFVQSNINIANESKVITSSDANNDNDKQCQIGIKAVDGIISGYSQNICSEWTSKNEGEGAWIQFFFDSPREIHQITLYDRPNENDHILDGILLFSDGTSIQTGELPNNGFAKDLVFDQKKIDWVKFTVIAVSDKTQNIGLSEVQIFGN